MSAPSISENDQFEKFSVESIYETEMNIPDEVSRLETALCGYQVHGFFQSVKETNSSRIACNLPTVVRGQQQRSHIWGHGQTYDLPH